MQFRWEWVLVPLACLTVFWFLSASAPACHWDEVLSFANAKNGAEYSKLAILGCVVTAIVAVARVLHRRHDED